MTIFLCLIVSFTIVILYVEQQRGNESDYVSSTNYASAIAKTVVLLFFLSSSAGG